MKKRVLSMLLLLAMVVTALPLVALPVVAAEGTDEKLFTEEEYNALYVEGAYYAFDFYKTNDHWDPNGEASVTMTAPEIGTVRNTLNGYVWAGDPYFHYTGTGADTTFNSTSDGTNNLTIDNGYLDTTPFNYISLQLTESNQANGAGSTIQQVRAYDAASSGSYGLSFCDIRVLVSGEVVTYLSKGKGSAPAASNSFLAPNKAVADMTTPYSYTLAYKIDQTTGQGPMAFYQGASEIFKYSAEIEESTDVTYGFTANTKVEHYTFWSIGDDRLYGARYYNKVLTDTEVAQNHFADIMKWFRLDLTVAQFLLEKGADLSALYTEAAKYTFDSEKTVVEKAMSGAANGLLAELYKTDAGAAAALKTAISNGLDVDKIAAYPKGAIPTVYAVLLRGTGDVAGEFATNLKTDLLANVTGDGVLDEAGYNALYVEGAYYAFDFYKTNDHWDPNGEASVVAVEPNLTKADTNPLNAFVWAGSANFHDKRAGGDTAFKSAGTKTVTIDNGYLDTNPFDYLSLYLTESNLANGAGSTIQQVRAYNAASPGAYGLSFADIRFQIENKTVQYLAFCNGSKGTAASASNSFLSPNKTVADMTTPYSYTFAHKIDETTGKGPAAFYQGATEIFKYSAEIEGSEDVDYGKTANTIHEHYVYWHGYDKLYGARYYNKVLTDTEVAQNHFADIAKWFKLDLAGFDALSDKTGVYEAVTGFTFNSEKDDVQAAVTGAILSAQKADRKVLGAGDLPETLASLSYEYFLDFSEFLAAKRDMKHVLDTVTAEKLLGQNMTQAQATLDEAIFDAENYLSYWIDGETTWNDFLLTVAGKFGEGDGVDLEDLMALPKAARLAAVSLTTESAEALNAAKDAYVASVMQTYFPDTAEAGYNALYVEGAYYAFDFYKTNDHWDPNGEASVVAVGPDLTKADTNPLNAFVWAGSANFHDKRVGGDTTFKSAGTKTVTIDNGYLDTNPFDYLSLYLTESNKANGAGSTIQQVRAYNAASPGDYGLSFADIRFQISGNTVQYLAFCNGSKGTAASASNSFLSPNKTVADMTTPYSYTFAHKIDETTGKGPAAFYQGATEIFKYSAEIEGSEDVDYRKTANTIHEHYVYWHGYDKLYGARYYNKVLTDTEVKRNHVADLAKWYRLDMTGYDPTDADQVEALCTALAGYTVGGTTAAERAAIQAAVDTVLIGEVDYAALAGELDADFLALAEKYSLPVKTLLSIKEKASRDIITATVTDEFSIEYAANATVMRSMLDDAMAFLNSVEFLGVQVRTGGYAGIRGLYAFDEELFLSLAERGIEVGGNITCITTGETVSARYAIVDGEIVGQTEENGKTAKVQHYTIGDTEYFGFVNSVVYPGEYATAEYYNWEFAYEVYVKVDDVVYTRTISYGDLFGGNDAISAYEVFDYFKDDPTVNNEQTAALFEQVLAAAPQQ